MAGGRLGSSVSRTALQSRSSISRSEEHTSELQSPDHLACRLLLEKKNLVHVIFIVITWTRRQRAGPLRPRAGGILLHLAAPSPLCPHPVALPSGAYRTAF